MIEVSEKEISLDALIAKVTSHGSGWVETYRARYGDLSSHKFLSTVQCLKSIDEAEKCLNEIIDKAGTLWNIQNVAVAHRVGKLNAGDINVAIAVASNVRSEAKAACEYILTQFNKIHETASKN